MEELHRPIQISLMGLILDREKHAKMLEAMSDKKVFFSLVLLGEGTANSKILNYLGLGRTEKAVALSILPTEMAHEALHKLDEKVEFSKPGHGVGFLAPIQEGCYHKLVRLAGDETGGEAEVEMKAMHDVILVVLNRGYTEEVMEAARAAGATGGTVLHARGCGLSGAEKFFGITIQPEKEIIMILANDDISCGIMQAIADNHGPGTDANAVSFSMPASHVMGIGNDVPHDL